MDCTHPPIRTSIFFYRQNVKNNAQHALKTFFIQTIFQPCRSKGSKEIFIKIWTFSTQKIRDFFYIHSRSFPFLKSIFFHI